MTTKEKVMQAIESAQRRIEELRSGRQTSDNLQRIKQYEEQIAYLTSKLPGLENSDDHDDDLKEYLLKVMGVPAGMQPKDDEKKNSVNPLTLKEMESRPHKKFGDFTMTEDGMVWLLTDTYSDKASESKVYKFWKSGSPTDYKAINASETISDCPKCQAKGAVLRVGDKYECLSCGAKLKRNDEGYIYLSNEGPYHVKCEYCSASIKEVATERETYAGGVCDACKAKGLAYGSSGPRKNSRGQVGKPLTIRFIEPGLVHYDDVGTVLVSKEVLDKMNASMAGRPIFNVMHKEVTNQDFSAGHADGVAAHDAKFNPEKGWFEVTGLFWDEETLANIRNGYNVSCAYDVKRWGPGGVHNNIPYDREVLEGEYTHLAIVDNPRYERAKIIHNQGGPMKLKFWEKDKPAEAREMELANAKTDINGKEMTLEKVLELASVEATRQETLANSKASDESIVEINGQKMTLAKAKELAGASLKNADDEKAKKDKEDEERKNAEEKEKADKDKKEKEEMENTAAHETGSHKASPLENCASCKKENAEHFEGLKNAAARRSEPFSPPSLMTPADRVKEGLKRYGPKVD